MTKDLGRLIPDFHVRPVLLMAVAVAILCGGAPAIAQDAAGIEARIERLRACVPSVPRSLMETNFGSRGPIDMSVSSFSDAQLADPEDWRIPESAVSDHVALREPSQQPLPAGGPQILLYTRSDHWPSFLSSLAASRGSDGIWRVDEVREADSGDEVLEVTHQEWRLSDKRSRDLDGLIDDPCLYLEPTNSLFASLVTSLDLRWTLELRGARADRVATGRDSGFGLTAAVRTVLLGSRREASR